MRCCSTLRFALAAFAMLLSATSLAEETPEWIRAPRMVQSFELAARAEQARMQVAAEFCTCTVQINDQTVAVIEPFAAWLELDVSEHLRPGANEITLACEPVRPQYAIALELVSTDIAGGKQRLRSSPNWGGEALGRVSPKLWQSDRTRREITPFDDYTQWKQASGAPTGSDPATFMTQPGFEIELVRSAADDENSWVSLAIDPQGRLVIAREDKGLLRMTLAPDGSQVTQVETINDTLLECRGLLFAHDALYANANNSKGLYRLRDTTGDGQLDEVKLLREFPGSVGHGRNDLALGPDGMVYSIHGDAVELPADDILDRTSPLREARRGIRTREGHVVRTDRNGRHWELVASGLRNPFGIDFNSAGDLFTYDADAEHDMGSPWYRATRVVHIRTGSDYGWRGRTKQWPAFFDDRGDNSIPAGQVGKGSPTAVKSGQRSAFPEPYRQAMFALDWAYGRVLACHLLPRGAGYLCRPETFLKGRPLNVTDLDFDASGSLYLITGGRKTKSALYRVRYAGSEIKPEPIAKFEQQAAEIAQQSRGQFTKLAAFHGKQDPQAIETVWPYLASDDPALRHAARIALEHQPVATWKSRALAEPEPRIAIPALLALAETGDHGITSQVLPTLDKFDVILMSKSDQLLLLEAYELCLAAADPTRDPTVPPAYARLAAWYPDANDGVTQAPTGLGVSVNWQLGRLLSAWGKDPQLVAKTMPALAAATSQEQRLHALYVLRNQRSGWSDGQHEHYFQALAQLDREALAGEGMPGFLARIREEAVAALSADQRERLGPLLEPGGNQDEAVPSITRKVIRDWKPADIEALLAADPDHQPDVQRGQALFRELLCSHCHRSGSGGGVLGPDLSSVGNRFGRRDLLVSILQPSRVVAEKYRHAEVTTLDGRVFTGRVVTGGDYRSPTLRIAPDPLRPSKFVELEKNAIDTHRDSPLSPMPAGLLNSLTQREIQDLLAYLQAGAPAGK